MPVSVTIGEAQNGHSLAWMAASNSIRAPQLGHWATRIATVSDAGSAFRSTARRSSSGMRPRFSGTFSSLPQWAHFSASISGA
jgi:hypothetical protein